MNLGQLYTYITIGGEARASICSSVQEGGPFLSIFLNPGDAQYASTPMHVLVLQNVPLDPTGLTPNSYH